MPKVTTEIATVHISETDLREILKAMDRAKEVVGMFTTEPMPDYDMDQGLYEAEKQQRGEVEVSSVISKTFPKFVIQLEREPHTQESVGYRWKNKETLRCSK